MGTTMIRIQRTIVAKSSRGALCRFYTKGRENRLDWSHSELPRQQEDDQPLKEASIRDQMPGPAFSIDMKSATLKEKQDAQTGRHIDQNTRSNNNNSNRDFNNKKSN